jgi:hypothetical protein
MKTVIEKYCQYLLSTQVNYTCTFFADHVAGLSHDSVDRFLPDEKLTPRLLWEQVSPLITQSSYAYIVFDDTVLYRTGQTTVLGECAWHHQRHRRG